MQREFIRNQHCFQLKEMKSELEAILSKFIKKISSNKIENAITNE